MMVVVAVVGMHSTAATLSLTKVGAALTKRRKIKGNPSILEVRRRHKYMGCHLSTGAVRWPVAPPRSTKWTRFGAPPAVQRMSVRPPLVRFSLA